MRLHVKLKEFLSMFFMAILFFRHIIILIYRVLCQFIVFLTGGITYV